MGTCARLSALTLVALLAACKAGPDYHAPATTATGGWSEPPPAAVEPVDLDHWWKCFADPTLDAVIARGLERNLDLAQAGARIAQARALRASVSGERLPTLAAEAGVTRREQSENGPLPIRIIPGIARNQTIYQPEFDAQWELDLFGGVRRGVEAADARVQGSIEDQRAVALAVAAEIARDYLLMRGAQARLVAHAAASAAAARTLELVRTRQGAGDASSADVALAESQWNALQAALPGLEAEARSAALGIAALDGDPPEATAGLLGTAAGEHPLVPIPVGERADLLRRRPDVRSAERALAASSADVGVAKAQWFPQLVINASAGFQSLASGNLLAAGSRDWTVAPLISWRVFDGGRVEAQIRASEARSAAAAAFYEKTVLQALTEAESALNRYRRGLEATAGTERARAAAARGYELMQQRYEQGDVSLLELLEAERGLRDAEERLALVRTQTATDLVALFKALGGGWRDLPAATPGAAAIIAAPGERAR